MSELANKTPKNNAILIASLAASIGLHILGVYFLMTHPMIFRYSLRSLFGTSTPSPDFLDSPVLLEKNRVVKEVFEHILVLSPHLQQPFDLVELPRGVSLAPSKESEEYIAFCTRESQDAALQEDKWTSSTLSTQDYAADFEEQELLALNSDAPHLALDLHIQPIVDSYAIEQIAIPSEEAIYIIDPIAVAVPENLIATAEPQDSAQQIAEHLFARSLPHEGIFDPVEEKNLEIDTSLGIHKLGEPIPFFSHPPLAKMQEVNLHFTSLADDLDSYLPSWESAVLWNDDFDVDIRFLPHPKEKGYIFSLALTPNFDISQYSLKHDILFLIDRNARKHRFEVFKRAVIKALASLQQGDSFNIFIIDKKLTRFHAKSLTVNQKSIRAAEHFLEKQSDDTLFAAGDIYSSLETLLPEIPETEGIVHSAILVTDGAMHLSTKKQQQVLNNWIENNNNKLSLYTAAVGQSNDLLMLDLLSTISGGRLLWSDTHASFPRKLAKLVLDLKDPIATDVMIDAIPLHPHAHVTLAHSVFPNPTLFSHQPYVVLGSIDVPGPFELIIQARHRDQWVAIKKTISFIDGSKADRTLNDQWSAAKSLHSYVGFLSDGKSSHLKEARDILKKSRSDLTLD